MQGAGKAARTDVAQSDQAARQHRLGLALRLRVALADRHHRHRDIVEELRDSRPYFEYISSSLYP